MSRGLNRRWLGVAWRGDVENVQYSPTSVQGARGTRGVAWDIRTFPFFPSSFKKSFAQTAGGLPGAHAWPIPTWLPCV